MVKVGDIYKSKSRTEIAPLFIMVTKDDLCEFDTFEAVVLYDKIKEHKQGVIYSAWHYGNFEKSSLKKFKKNI